MLRGLVFPIVVLGLLAGAAITLIGLLAPLAPALEIVNHFRPFLLGGFVALFAVAAVFRLRRFLIPVSAFALLNGALFVLPLTFQATQASTPGTSSAAMKVISFNMWQGNRDLDDIETFLRGEDADAVLLQEFNRAHAETLLPALADLYPHQLSCADKSRCHLALLSKTPWAEASAIAGTMENPALVWARFETALGTYRIAGLHHAWPLQSYAQANHTDWLIDWRRSVSEPLLIAGDFNLTPFSWKLSKFAWKTGLKRYATYQRSWPGHKYAPAFLIDHVFSTEAFRPLDVRVGPALGSDHLPIIATVMRETQ